MRVSSPERDRFIGKRDRFSGNPGEASVTVSLWKKDDIHRPLRKKRRDRFIGREYGWRGCDRFIGVSGWGVTVASVGSSEA